MRALVELLTTSDVDAELRPAVWETAITALKMLTDNSTLCSVCCVRSQPDSVKVKTTLRRCLLSWVHCFHRLIRTSSCWCSLSFATYAVEVRRPVIGRSILKMPFARPGEELADSCMSSIGMARFLSVLASPSQPVRTEALIVFKQLFRKNNKAAPPSVDASSLAPCIALLQVWRPFSLSLFGMLRYCLTLFRAPLE